MDEVISRGIDGNISSDSVYSTIETPFQRKELYTQLVCKVVVDETESDRRDLTAQKGYQFLANRLGQKPLVAQLLLSQMLAIPKGLQRALAIAIPPPLWASPAYTPQPLGPSGLPLFKSSIDFLLKAP